MRRFVSIILSLSIGLSPLAVNAQSAQSQQDFNFSASYAYALGQHDLNPQTGTGFENLYSVEDLGAGPDDLGMVQDSNELQLGSDKLTIETTIAVAESEVAEAKGAKWFQAQLARVENQKIRYTISHATVEGESDPVQDGRLQLTEAQKPKLRVIQLAKSSYENIKAKAKSLFSKATGAVTKFLTKSEQRYRVTFAMTRLTLNGSVMSYTFASDFFLGGTVPLSVAITAGLSGGIMSGLFNYFSSKYSAWLDNPGHVFHLGDKVLGLLKSMFPRVDIKTLSEIVKVSKWMAMEGVFFMIPVTILAAFGYPIATAIPLFAAKLFGTVFGGTLSQYSWDAAITRYQNAGKLLYSKDQDALSMVNFRASMAFVAVSFLSVAVSTASLGSEWWKSYTLLGAMGLLGHKIKKKIYAKIDDQIARVTIEIPKEAAPPCSLLFLRSDNYYSQTNVVFDYSAEHRASGE